MEQTFIMYCDRSTFASYSARCLLIGVGRIIDNATYITFIIQRFYSTLSGIAVFQRLCYLFKQFFILFSFRAFLKCSCHKMFRLLIRNCSRSINT